jgi:hypothetical protein
MKPSLKLNLVFLILAYYTNIDATIMKEASIEKMTKASDLIIIGKVESINCIWVENGKMIHTFVTISIESLVKGVSDKKNIVVEIPGGTVGEITAMAMGEAKFFSQEKVILFLRKNRIIPSKTYFVVGLCQGKFRINPNDIDNRNVLVRNLEGITIIEKKGSFIPRYLDELINEIKKFS